MRPFFEFAKKYFKENKITGAEVGVHVGYNAQDVLSNFPTLEKYYLVDSYLAYYEMPNQSDHDRFKKLGKERVESFNNVEWIYSPSIIAAQEIQNGYLDFVYIDADHSYEACLDDIMAWSPKIRKGGLIGGHDYDNLAQDWGVKRASETWAKSSDYQLNHKDCDWWIII